MSCHERVQITPLSQRRSQTTPPQGESLHYQFVRLIDALSIAHPDMRADADKARGAIPALRAKLRQAAN